MGHLMEVGQATVEELATLFAVSRMTIHRDLDEMEREGLLRRVRGGATIESSSQFESDFRYRKRLAVEEKKRIAAAAVKKVEVGQTVILDDGTTAAAMAGLLMDCRPLTIITNNLELINLLSDVNGLTLIALGGQYRRRFHGFFGLVTEQTLRNLRADVAFLSASAVTGTTAFHQDQEVVKTGRAMIAAATRRYMLLDHTKFDRTALNSFTELSEFDSVLTDRVPSEAAREALESIKVPLEIVEKYPEKQ